MENNPEYLELLSNRIKELLKKQKRSADDLFLISQLFSYFFESLSNNESVGFTSLFSRVAFVSVKYKFPSLLIFDNHAFRRLLESDTNDLDIEKMIKYGAYLIEANTKHIYGQSLGISVKKPKLENSEAKIKKGTFKRIVKGIVIVEPSDWNSIQFIDNEIPHIPGNLIIDTEDFKKQFRILIKNLELPLNINLVDVNIEGNTYRAKAFVVKPNFMVGVTSISECFQSKGSFALKYLVGKLVPSDSSIHMLIGNIVNYFLDELIHNPDLNYEAVVKKTFKLAPEAFSLLNDQELVQCLSKIKYHFYNLQKVVKNELAEAGITKDQAYLEPSFYSDDYGISGRLDLYHYNQSAQQSDIVELKSGKLFRSNSYGLNENHYIQTLLYDLIIESLYQGKVKSSNYILYSYLDKQRLRYAPRIRSKQYEALLIRNDIMMIEYILGDFENLKYSYLLDSLHPEKIPIEFTFVKRDANKLRSGLSELNALELTYYKAFIAFLSKEYSLSKTGEHGIFKSNGMASLWLDPLNEKINQFTVLSYLQIVQLKVDEDIPFIKLDFSDKSNHLSKFRVGDIVVMYPYQGSMRSPLKNQIFKCTILSIDNTGVGLRLRARQKNADIFKQYDYWNIESDVLDSGFQKQFHSLYDFIHSNPNYRKKIFGLKAPELPKDDKKLDFIGVTVEQNILLNNAIKSQDYFLLWGPPGTGKTSIMIKNLVDHYYSNTNSNILLLAYTNRAVDEICSAIEEIINGDFIRIGSRYSSNPKYLEKLFSIKTEEINSRSELLELLANARIFVSTISSFQSKREMVKLKTFDIAIVDEASQLLEPMLVGFLSQFKKYILIGDHKQLPAVVAQNGSDSTINPKLKEIGMEGCGISLFERMYKNCIKNDWNWAYGVLSYQGRMHADILNFISKEFYDGSLKLFPGMNRLVEKSQLKWNNEIQKCLIEKRMLFIDTKLDSNISTKSNREEALLVSKLIKIWLDIYEFNKIEFTTESLGIITPFRAQIARIKEEIQAKEIQEEFTIDTIERYQGGSRNHIIISLAVNQADLLDSITNVSNEGIDRKLNVALTRAKEHIVIFGTKEVLIKNQTYCNLISYCEELTVDQLMNS